jgi:micrococcal nuclease
MESTRRDVTSRVARHAGKLAVLLLALLLASCSSDVSPLEDLASSADAREARPQPGELVSFVVERAVDGGTVEIAGELHRADTVRMIGVDTPESADPDQGVEPMGKEAAALTERSLEGRTVELVADEEPLDPYGRALSYVYLEDGTMFNAALLREGLAQVAIFPPNTAHADDFYRYQEEASAAGRGIWGLPVSDLCLLADRGNGFGQGSPTCRS